MSQSATICYTMLFGTPIADWLLVQRLAEENNMTVRQLVEYFERLKKTLRVGA